MKAAGYLAIIGGTLLFMGGAAGWGIFALVKEFLGPHLTGDIGESVAWVLEIFIMLAALGGLMVMGGGYCILKDMKRIGKVLIMIGLATGIISLIIGLIVALSTDSLNAFTGSLLGLTGIGTMLAIVAKYMA